MGRNNFGWKSRDMSKAGQFALNDAARNGHCAYASAATHGERFGQFADFAKASGARWLEDVTPDLVRDFGRGLADQVRAGEVSPAYAQNLVSSINTTMKLVTRGGWESVSPVKDCGIEKRSKVRADAPAGLDRESFGRAMDSLRESGMNRQASIAELARDFGLRSEEASLFNAKRGLEEARAHGRITVSDGTKGGRTREVPITGDHQFGTLERAAEIQGDHYSLVPADQTWKEFREGDLRDGREAIKESLGGHGYHDLRAAYACERYEDLTGREAPVVSGEGVDDRDADRAARETIGEELGHGRSDVVSEYVGGRR